MAKAKDVIKRIKERDRWFRDNKDTIGARPSPSRPHSKKGKK